MKNHYEAPEIFIVSKIDSFVLGSKPYFVADFDAIYGLCFRFWPFDDLDEGED
ncbi:MAG TPA: hypothetical protein VF088_21335 [Pyrinomonadaceae bacterium]